MTAQVLEKKVRFSQLFAIGFGTVVGSAWIIVAASWVEAAGSLGAIAAFVTGAFAVAVVGLSYGEVGALFPQSGGEVVYAYEGMGSLAAFTVGSYMLLMYVAVCALEAAAVAWILGFLIPDLNGPVLYEVLGEEIRLGSLLIGLAGTGFITWVNYRGGYFSATLQNWVAWTFAAASILFITVGIINGGVENARPFLQGGSYQNSWLGVLAVLATVPVWYAGFNTLPQALGEIENLDQSKYFVRVLLLVLLAGMLFYSGVILAISFAVPREVLVEAELPVATAMFVAFDSLWVGNIVLIAAFLGLVSTWNGFFYAGTRVLFCLGRARLVNERFAGVNKYGAPGIAILFVGMVGSLGAIAGRSVVLPVINLAGLCYAAAYLFTTISLIRLRKSKPELERPYRMPGGIWLPIGAVAVATTIFVMAAANIWFSPGNGVRIELLILAVWTLFSAVLWHMEKKQRSAIDESQRTQLIHLR